jgi:hypothetical protein
MIAAIRDQSVMRLECPSPGCGPRRKATTPCRRVSAWVPHPRQIRSPALASNLCSTYAKASPKVRRQMNQAIFEEILIEVDGSVIYARMAQPFAAFHDEEFRRWLADGATNPGPQEVRGSNEALLVEVKGLEPSASTLRT